MEDKFEKLYYSPDGYWRGETAVNKLADAAGSSTTEARQWLQQQPIYQIYLPPPSRITRPKFLEDKPNAVHQADILFLPRDKYKRKVYKYALQVVDLATRFKASRPLVTKSSSEVLSAFEQIYNNTPLTWPKLLQVDPGTEFKGVVTSAFTKHGTEIRRGVTNLHRNQAVVERFNRTLSERVFAWQYDKEMKTGERCREWVKIIDKIVSSLNNDTNRMTGLSPAEAMKANTVPVRLPVHDTSAAGATVLEPQTIVRYLYEPGELEGQRYRATDPIWSVQTHQILDRWDLPNQPSIYHLTPPAPKRSFVREELQVVPSATAAPQR